jgi:hypothetical protein
VELSDGEQGDGDPDETREHVPLGIPGITLRSEKCVGLCASCYGGPPFDKFIPGADGLTYGDGEEIQPRSRQKGSPSEQYFPGDDGGHKSLGEVADAVVMVAGEVEVIANPVEQRHFGVSVVTADHQDDHVNCDQGVSEMGERESAVGPEEDRRADDGREDFHEPREVIVRFNCGPNEDHADRREKRDVESFHSRLQVTAQIVEAEAVGEGGFAEDLSCANQFG